MTAATFAPPAQKLVLLYKMRDEEPFPFVGYWNAEAGAYLDALTRHQHDDVITWQNLPEGPSYDLRGKVIFPSSAFLSVAASTLHGGESSPESAT